MSVALKVNKLREILDDKKLAKTIYVLGESSSFGWGVDYEKTYSSLLV